jgi:hypothetical protein
VLPAVALPGSVSDAHFTEYGPSVPGDQQGDKGVFVIDLALLKQDDAAD